MILKILIRSQIVPHKIKTQGPGGFKKYQKIEKEEMLPNSFYEFIFTSLLKFKKNSEKEK